MHVCVCVTVCVQVLEVAQWFLEGGAAAGLPVCRVKNGFAAGDGDVVDGYRDLKVYVTFEGPMGLRIIGEIQIHDRALHELKLKVCVRCRMGVVCSVCE